MTIKAARTVSLKDFMERIAPRTEYSQDVLLADFNDAITTGRDFVMIYKDYEVRVPLEEVQAYMTENWSLDTGKPEDIPNSLDILLPRVETPPVETPEERELAAKHPKTRPEIPKFKPGKRAPVAPPEDEIL
jgi:hypothetical protein